MTDSTTRLATILCADDEDLARTCSIGVFTTLTAYGGDGTTVQLDFPNKKLV